MGARIAIPHRFSDHHRDESVLDRVPAVARTHPLVDTPMMIRVSTRAAVS